LRNPLNVVKTSAYYLLNAKSATPEKLREHLERIERQVGIADGVITTLSNFVKMPLPQRTATSLAASVSEALETDPPPASVRVSLAIPPSLPSVLVDANQLRIVLGNLIRNAVDAMPHGGELTIGATLGDGAVDVSVADTGGGISPENLHRIAEPLFSTKTRGIGLGLAIVQSILEKHGSRLQVASELGAGTRMGFRLEVAQS
jgi:signal transduction histidine kinase